MDTPCSTAAPSSWDFFSGRGEGATRADRWAVRQRRASWALGGTLSWDGDFWAYAKAIEAGTLRVDDAAKLYVPRSSPAQEAIAYLLLIASANIDERFDRTGIRAGAGHGKVTAAAGPISYFVEAENLKANAFSEAGMEILDLGALLVSRRGAMRCLQCDRRLPSSKRLSYRGGDRACSELVNYCPDCLSGAVGDLISLGAGNHNLPNFLPFHFRAIQKVLDDAAPPILEAASAAERLNP